MVSFYWTRWGRNWTWLCSTHPLIQWHTQATINKIFAFIDEHSITPFIGASFKFSEIKQAVKAQEKGVDGKIVVVMD